MFDYTKMDLSKFDAAKIFSVDAALKNIEEQTETVTGYITDAKVREMVKSVNAATFAFVHAQVEAAKAYGESVKAIVEKQTKTLA